MATQRRKVQHEEAINILVAIGSESDPEYDRQLAERDYVRNPVDAWIYVSNVLGIDNSDMLPFSAFRNHPIPDLKGTKIA